MNVNQLHRLLGRFIEAGHGRTKVCVFKPSFSHPLEQDGVVYLDIDGAVSEYTPMSDGDGYTALDSKGREKMRSTIALYGNDACKHGNLWPCEQCKAPGKEGA